MIDPAWEYYVPNDPEIVELLEEASSTTGFDSINDNRFQLNENDDSNIGLRFGVGNPDKFNGFHAKERLRPIDFRTELRHIVCANHSCRQWFMPRNRDQRYCSRECFYVVPRRRRYTVRLCPVCEKPFTPKRSRMKYCSRRCGAINMLSRERIKFLLEHRYADKRIPLPREYLVELACAKPECGRTFKPSHSSQRFCSLRCRPNGAKKQFDPNGICQKCNQPFIRDRKQQVLCSRKCAASLSGTTKQPNGDKNDFRRLYNEGKSYAEIATLLGYSVVQMKRWRKELGLPGRGRGHKPPGWVAWNKKNSPISC